MFRIMFRMNGISRGSTWMCGAIVSVLHAVWRRDAQERCVSVLHAVWYMDVWRDCVKFAQRVLICLGAKVV